MKVDILGRGIIPGLGTLAPVYNKDLNEASIKRILSYAALRVYLTGTSVPVTRKNLHELIMLDQKRNGTTNTAPAVETSVAAKVEKKKEVEAASVPVVETKVEEPAPVEPVVESEVVEEKKVEETPVVEEAKEEAPAPVQQQTSSKKKKNK